MKASAVIVLLVCAVGFSSCHEEAKIEVTNRVHNVRLDNISYSGVAVGSNLLPGESVEAVVSDRYGSVSFPIIAPLEFYMVKGDRRVYLKTKASFHLEAGGVRRIVIEDGTEMVDGMR
jgi:hypothetical protein